MTPWWKRDVPRTEAVEIKGAEINRLAAELQIVAGGRGVSTSAAMAAIATALANEVVAVVQRNPDLTIDEMLDWACESVREMTRVTADPSSNAPKGKSDLTEQQFAQLAMRIVNLATVDAAAIDAMAATAKALGMIIAVFTRRPEDTGFDELLRWGQNIMVAYAREAHSKLTSAPGSS
jgi:hypothetical protein